MWVQLLLDAHVLQPLYQHLAEGSFEIRCRAGRCICALLNAGEFEQKVVIVQQAVVPQLCQVLQLADLESQQAALDAMCGLFEATR